MTNGTRAGLTALFALLALTVGCGDDSRGSGTCEGGEFMCGTACVNLLTSYANCGRCGESCTGSQVCSAGVCTGGGTGMCDVAGETECAGACVNTMTNASHCGGCGMACLAGTPCVNGSCGGTSVDGGTDVPVISGDCVPACDPNRSSSCGTMAGSTTAQCLCGMFNQCPIGQACVNNSGSYLCANLMFDPMNCGMVGNACAEGESCNGGVCTCNGGATCGIGQACCADGCIDTAGDAMNCGGCGIACGPGESCNGGTCGCGAGPACAEPMAGVFGMGGNPGESCCGGTCVANTATSCACEACTGEDTCQVGGGGIIPGMGGEVSVCCGDESVAILGCGGGFPGLP